MNMQVNVSAANLAAIPLVDARTGGPVRHAIEGRARAFALHDACLNWLPRAARLLMPVMDGASRRWLRHSASPYIAEIEAIAQALGLPGTWFLNGSYEWGCTALARDEGGAPWIARTLDWPFPGLGRHVEIARMRGDAGEFYSVTWPGYVGTLTAMAPGALCGGDESGAASAPHAGTVDAPRRHGAERGAHMAHPFGAARSSAARGVRDLPQLSAMPGRDLSGLRLHGRSSSYWRAATQASAASSSAPRTVSQRGATIRPQPMTGGRARGRGRRA